METLSKEQRIIILRNRARNLAEGDNFAGESNVDYLRVAKFSLGNEFYCIDTNYIQEILSVKEITPLPGAPSIVEGIINVRGQIIAVFNPYKIFQVKSNDIIIMNKVIILSSTEHHKEFGIIVETILDTLDIALNEINPAPQNLSGSSAGFIRGVSINGTIVLDAQAFITSNELIINQ